ncbi:MFS transporter [Hwanghaeella grinnelliae]|uniref:MFS transporter n=1 Tax=Hwanghaeella grinnelliae TaxID=2500179 RepID=A0A3S2W4A1_9PROT|nr:MFS transporter [Hwanghaeella grinnelliae]RVU36120.1 MFS transporter [Hwanghaeella grinnelliae]
MQIAKRATAGWCLYDWANSAFPTIIGTFIFSVYFAQGIYGDADEGAKSWAYALSISGLIVAVVSPVLGAIADHAGGLKRWLGLFTAMAAIGSCLLWFAEPDPAYAIFALVIVVLSAASLDLGQVFYNALLTPNAPAHMLGRVSGWGWGVGYLGGLTALALTLVGFVGLGDMLQPLFALDRESAQHVRIVGPMTGIWFAVFCLPLFLFSKDFPPTGLSVAQAVPKGLSVLARTLGELPRHGHMLRFLIASAIYRDGLTTLFAVGGLYAAGVHGMDTGQILIFAIGLNVTAGLGAAGFAWMDDGIGSRITVLVSLVGLILVGVPLLLVDDITLFIAFALVLGIFVGPTQAASRSLMARLAPNDKEAEYFGLYSLTGKAAAIFGPALYGLGTEIFDSQRAGMAIVVTMFAVGAAILLTVREPERA